MPLRDFIKGFFRRLSAPIRAARINASDSRDVSTEIRTPYGASDMPLWDFIKDLFSSPTIAQIAAPIPYSRSTKPDPGRTLTAGRSYFRLRLADMALAQSEWALKKWYPAVQTVVRARFGDTPQIEIPGIVDSSRLFQNQGGKSDVIVHNALLAPTIPFNGGDLSVSAGLMSVEGADYLGDMLGALGGLASILAVPQLSAAMNIAQPLGTAIQAVFKGGRGKFHLSTLNAFGATQMKGGYLALVRASESTIDPTKLVVVDAQLRLGTAPTTAASSPLQGFDYILLECEVFEERDDWDSFKAINEPFQLALDALAEPSANAEAEKAKIKLAEDRLLPALRAVQKTPELTQADRRRVIDVLKDRFAQGKQDLNVKGLYANSQLTLAQLIKQSPIDIAEAVRRGPITSQDIQAPD